MKKLRRCITPPLFLLAFLVAISSSASVTYDKQVPQLAFAAQEIENAQKAAGRDELKIQLLIELDASSPEAFEVRLNGPDKIVVTGSDATGAMYGGLEIANRIRLGLPITDLKQKPFIPKRGIKFNIPWDARTPSYDDTGDAAQNNIETIWDFDFWKEYLDDLARYRYNVLSLWSTHPYPSILQLKDYPDVALDDVYRVSDGVFKPANKNRLQGIDLDEPGTMELVKEISIKQKIKHWQRVFQYAGDRGIEIYLFHWNVMTFGATGKHGITPDQTNPITVDYMRQCISEALRTYPQIAGIGVTAGENADNHLEGEYSIENFLFSTYGRGIMDVLEEQPDRKVRFIFRQHMSGLGPITDAFADFPDEFNTSYKYAIGHMYSMRKPQLFDRGFRGQVEEFGVPSWLNLRNDDMFVLRWGGPDFARDYLQQMPLDVMPGFYMGSDGYVWGREFISKNPKLSGQLEINKHWYRFQMWGELAYNPKLGRSYWEAVLRARFPGVDATQLYKAWAATSEIVPQVNSATFCPNDAHFAPEGCIDRRGFMTVDELYFDFWPMVGSGIHSVEEWGKAVVAGDELEGITPLQVANNLDTYAATALAALPALRAQAGENAELEETLNDMEAMAWLGRYYADKMRGAAKLAAFRVTTLQTQFADDAVAHLKDAAEEWKRYQDLMSSRYKSQLMQRTHFMDWESVTSEVEEEIVAAERERDRPEITFTNINHGDQLPANAPLRVELAASDKDGIEEVKLYLNGLLLQNHPQEPMIWSATSDELLKELNVGQYHLEAVAIDKMGTIGRRTLEIAVGDVSSDDYFAWQDEIHQVILEGEEVFTDQEVLDFPRLECYLKIRDDGRLVLDQGSPGKSGGLLWKAMMYNDHDVPHYSTIDKGQLVTYRGKPGQPEATPFKRGTASDTGETKLAITNGGRLILYREENGERTIVWKSEILEPWRL